MSRRHDIDADALTAALLQAVKEARAAQTAIEEAAKAGQTGQAGASVEAIRERLALLAELLDMGMEIVRALDKQLRAAQQAAGPGVASPLVIEAADAFIRLSRAIRLTMMLQTRAEDALRPLLAARPPARATAPSVPPPETVADDETSQETESLAEDEPVAEREPAEPLVEREAAAAALGRAAALGLYDDIRAAARECLFLDCNYADFLTRPLDQLIPDLCRDLGLTPARLREAGCEARLNVRPPPTQPPPLPSGSHFRPRSIPSHLAGASTLVFDRAAILHPPDSRSRRE